MSRTIDRRDFLRVMKRILDLRVYCLKHRVDPWAIRQALITALEMDTDVIRVDVRPKPGELEEFDVASRRAAREWIEAERKRLQGAPNGTI